MEINGELIRRVWDKASVIRGQNPEVFRMDVNGKWIRMKDFNNVDSVYGWTIYAVDGSEIGLHNFHQLIPIHTFENTIATIGMFGTGASIFQNPIF